MKEKASKQAKMLRDTIRMLQARKGDWPAIADENNIGYSWLTKLAQDKIPDPSVNRIESLYLYLLRTKKPNRPIERPKLLRPAP